MQEKIEELFKIEGSISRFCNYLYELELYDNDNQKTYKAFLELYRLAALDEEKLFSSMTEEEINKLEAFFLDNNNAKLLAKYVNENAFDPKFLPFGGRLQSRIGEFKKHYFNVISFGNNRENIETVMNDASNTIPLIVDAIVSEYKDMYLSFLDEYIKEVEFFEVRKELTKEKYDVIYNASCHHEKELIKRGFKTDYSLYLTSELSSITKNHNYYDIYMDVRHKYINRSITTISEELDNFEKQTHKKDGLNISEIMLSYLRVRACMLMLDNISFKEIMDKLEASGACFENTGSLFDEDILTTILNDRKRHKVLSLRKK